MSITSAKINLDQVPGAVKVKLGNGELAWAIPENSPAVYKGPKHTILQIKLHELQQPDKYENTHQVRVSNGKKSAKDDNGRYTQYDTDIVGSGRTFFSENKAPKQVDAAQQTKQDNKVPF